MIVEHNGRRITAMTRRTRDGFRGVLVRVNGVQVYHYFGSAGQRSVDAAIEQTRREIDAVDAYDDDLGDPRFGSHWYARTDPRRELALRREGGEMLPARQALIDAQRARQGIETGVIES